MIIFNLVFFILSIVWNNPFVKAQNDDEFQDFREVRNYLFTPNNYYDVIKYEFNITPTRNVGKFDYYIFSDKGVYSLIMNRTELELWESEYYDQWLKDPTHDLHKYTNYLNTDNSKFMCKSLTAACQSSVQFSDRELYVVNVKNPTFESSTYVFKDNFVKYKNDPTAAELVYDPVNPPETTTKKETKATTTRKEKTSSKSSNSSTEATKTTKKATPSTVDSNDVNNKNNSIDVNGNEIKNNNSTNSNNSDKNDNNGNINDNNKNITDDDSHNSWWWWLIGAIILLAILLAMLIYGYMHRGKNDKIQEINNLPKGSMVQNNYNGSETEAKVVAYNPHHAVKRVAYNYKDDDITVERDNIVEITKRYNDGWANAINPKDGKECIIPLIILEGDLSEDLSNIPYEEKSSKNILATPESLFENEYISRKDYEEMKRNDEWMKKVKLMKHTKQPESSLNMITGDDQFKYISHPMQETKVENGIDSEQSDIGNGRQSMVATLVSSNTELLNADHILEVCEEEDYDEPEEGVIIKEEL